jgi:hypothetical protein
LLIRRDRRQHLAEREIAEGHAEPYANVQP